MKIGRYTVDSASRKEGGQAFVYFGAHPDTGRRVAIKVARPSRWSHDRMRREIKAQTAISHPNVLPILEHATDFSWYVMPQAECSLEELGPFHPDHWMTLRAGLLGITAAVDHAHECGYVHRDISAGNVLVFAAGWAIGDWGFVYVRPRGRPRMTQPLERFGTPEFMAPEMAIDPRNVGPPADIFSIGRVAAWATGIERDGAGDSHSPFARWWRVLIDGTTRYEPLERWRIADLRAHLRSQPPALPVREPRFTAPILIQREQPCAYCGSTAGVDRSERCLGCHALSPY